MGLPPPDIDSKKKKGDSDSDPEVLNTLDYGGDLDYVRRKGRREKRREARRTEGAFYDREESDEDDDGNADSGSAAKKKDILPPPPRIALLLSSVQRASMASSPSEEPSKMTTELPQILFSAHLFRLLFSPSYQSRQGGILALQALHAAAADSNVDSDNVNDLHATISLILLTLDRCTDYSQPLNPVYPVRTLLQSSLRSSRGKLVERWSIVEMMLLSDPPAPVAGFSSRPGHGDEWEVVMGGVMALESFVRPSAFPPSSVLTHLVEILRKTDVPTPPRRQDTIAAVARLAANLFGISMDSDFADTEKFLAREMLCSDGIVGLLWKRLAGDSRGSWEGGEGGGSAVPAMLKCMGKVLDIVEGAEGTGRKVKESLLSLISRKIEEVIGGVINSLQNGATDASVSVSSGNGGKEGTTHKRYTIQKSDVVVREGLQLATSYYKLITSFTRCIPKSTCSPTLPTQSYYDPALAIAAHLFSYVDSTISSANDQGCGRGFDDVELPSRVARRILREQKVGRSQTLEEKCMIEAWEEGACGAGFLRELEAKDQIGFCKILSKVLARGFYVSSKTANTTTVLSRNIILGRMMGQLISSCGVDAKAFGLRFVGFVILGGWEMEGAVIGGEIVREGMGQDTHGARAREIERKATEWLGSVALEAAARGGGRRARVTFEDISIFIDGYVIGTSIPSSPPYLPMTHTVTQKNSQQQAITATNMLQICLLTSLRVLLLLRLSNTFPPPPPPPPAPPASLP